MTFARDWITGGGTWYFACTASYHEPLIQLKSPIYDQHASIGIIFQFLHVDTIGNPILKSDYLEVSSLAAHVVRPQTFV